MAKIVDRFNVEGEDYFIEPVMDATPTEDSEKAITSGGVYAYRSSVPADNDGRFFTSAGAYNDKSNVPVSTGTAADEEERKNFTAGGAFEFFGHASHVRHWYPMLFPNLFGYTWHWKETSAFSGYVNTTCEGYYSGSVIIGTTTGAALITRHAYNANAITGLPTGASVKHIICPNGIALLGTERDGLYYANMNGTYSPVATACVGIPTTKVRVVALRYVPRFGNAMTERPLYIAVTAAYDASSPANSDSVWVSTDAVNWERATGITSTDTFPDDCIYTTNTHVYIISRQRRIYENVVTGEIDFHSTATIGSAGGALWLSKVDGYLTCAIISSGNYQYFVYARTPPSMSSGTNRAWQPASSTFSGTEPECPKFNYMGASRTASGSILRLLINNDSISSNTYRIQSYSGVAADVILNGVAYVLTADSSSSNLYRRDIASTSGNNSNLVLSTTSYSRFVMRGLTYVDGVLYVLCSDGTVLYSSYLDIIDQLTERGPQAICTNTYNTDTNFVGVYPTPN